MNAFARLAVATTLSTYLLIVLGGVVRATGAGLACPDWPLCHGRLIPPLEGPVLIEYSHRLVASVVGVLTLAVAVLAWQRRAARALRVLSLFALILVGVQILLGGLTVRSELSEWVVVAHLGTAMAFFATLIVLTALTILGTETAFLSDVRFRRLAVLTAFATYLLILMGGYLSASGAGLACPDWPLCTGELLPPLRGGVGVHVLHRLAAAIVSVLVIATTFAAYRFQRRPVLQAVSAVATSLLILQIILGALNIEYRLAPGVTTAHLANAAALFATLIVLAVLSRRMPEPSPSSRTPLPSGARSGSMTRILDYVSLTKPRIIVLLLVTTGAAMLVAAPGVVSPWIMLSTLLGGALASGSAGAINQILERDIDALMARTRRRPVAAGRVDPPFAFAFAFVLAALAFAVLAVFVNLLSALLAMLGLLFYVFIYTIWLKRATPQNIVIGGAAGAVPPLVGWAAATGRVELPAVLLFLIVFLWTPPHFWALSLYRLEDYTRAHVPMLPVVAGEKETRRQIVIYSVLLVATTLLLFPIGSMGWMYVTAAAALGAVFLWRAIHVRRAQTPQSARGLFSYSIVYLALLFAAMVMDRMLIT
jgi:protoheme IX farnesyltransferase